MNAHMLSYAHTCQTQKKENYEFFLFQCISIGSHLQKKQLFPGLKRRSWEKGGREQKLEFYATQKYYFTFWVCFLVVKTKPGVSFISGKCFIIEQYLKPQFFRYPCNINDNFSANSSIICINFHKIHNQCKTKPSLCI